MDTPPAAPQASDDARLMLCFSHLRWDLVFQRPQHLLTRAARGFKVLYFEEPVFADVSAAGLDITEDASGVRIAKPILPQSTAGADPAPVLRRLLDGWLAENPHNEMIAWYYTPMALAFSIHLAPDVCVYDCMDELSAFKNPPEGLTRWEDLLFERADLVFTGGYSLYEVKRRRHPRVFAFPSSVDVRHFAKACAGLPDPDDQAAIPKPRIGFFGVIDERMDLDLVRQAAGQLPDCQFVMLGPVVKIDPESLPCAPNLHWLGPKRYAELPNYLANWTAGWMPFAINASTRFISPTKTPEFLAAGLPVTSTAIADVVRDYGARGLVAIANAETIAEKLRETLDPPSAEWRARVEQRLASISWDKTWDQMQQHIERIAAARLPIEKRGA